jgi:hypothetical protein
MTPNEIVLSLIIILITVMAIIMSIVPESISYLALLVPPLSIAAVIFCVKTEHESEEQVNVVRDDI